MKVLITGGAGNLGQKLAQLFRENKDKVRLFDLPQADYSFCEGMSDIEITKGDIRDKEAVMKAVEGVDAILHLAALIPPASEGNRDFTMAINVGGTNNLIEAVGKAEVHFIFTSSVATYGDTSKEKPPIKVTHPQVALDFYAESKIESEKAVIESGLPYTILRIAPISIPEVLEPPNVWPFMEEQRVEFVNRDDVAVALFACACKREARGKIFNIAGGKTWQMLGRDYATALYEAIDLDIEDAVFSDRPGWFDWYDTAESQALLEYQNTPFPDFIAQLRQAAEEAFGL